MPQEIHVDIAADGALAIDATGFAGADCEQATRFLEEALGSVTQKRRKPEFHQHAARRQSRQIRAGR